MKYSCGVVAVLLCCEKTGVLSRILIILFILDRIADGGNSLSCHKGEKRYGGGGGGGIIHIVATNSSFNFDIDNVTSVKRGNGRCQGSDGFISNKTGKEGSLRIVYSINEG